MPLANTRLERTTRLRQTLRWLLCMTVTWVVGILIGIGLWHLASSIWRAL